MSAPTYQRMAEWVYRGGKRPTNNEIADYLEKLIGDGEFIDEVDAECFREAIIALRSDWNAAIEAAAKAVETHYLNPASLVSPQQSCAMAIRSLSRPQDQGRKG